VKLLYRLGATAYQAAIGLASLWSAKAKARHRGSRKALAELPATTEGQACFWMHCASVGEFEQGRPVWAELQEMHPEARFVLSFYSPSGYEQFCRKADVGEVVYLPPDTDSTARTWVARLSPTLALIVKYEWWLGYHDALSAAAVPTVLLSAAFRQNQPFFRWYGSAWRKALKELAAVFVQDTASAELVRSLGQNKVFAAGDTRLDRTLAVRQKSLNHDALQAFAKGHSFLLVAGSTWPADDRLIAAALTEFDNQTSRIGLCVAPHEVDASAVDRTIDAFSAFKPVRLSSIDPGSGMLDGEVSRVLVIDEIGLLSRLYRLGHAAYVGGGFGAGVHNTLEPAVYGIPIAVGPRNAKFVEVAALRSRGILSEVKSSAQLVDFLRQSARPEVQSEVLAKAETYIADNAGATQRILTTLAHLKLV